MSKTPNTTITVYELPFTEGLEARVVITKIGQRPPNDSDDVEVRGTLQLPILPMMGGMFPKLHSLLQFEDRLSLMGRRLSEGWGSRVTLEDNTICVQMSERYAYPTWKEAINTAEKDINFQLTKLIKALETRHQALVDADNV